MVLLEMPVMWIECATVPQQYTAVCSTDQMLVVITATECFLESGHPLGWEEFEGIVSY